MFETEYKGMIDSITPSAELISVTLVKTQAAAQDLQPKRQVKRRLMLVTLLILGLVGASAIELTPKQVVNWSGKTAIDFSHDTTPPEDKPHLIIEEMLRQKPENEMWQVESPSQGSTISYPSKFFGSMNEMLQYIKEADDSIFVPYSIPEGYHYTSGNIVFSASINTLLAGIAQLPTETLPDGITIKKWKAADSCKKDISFYHIGLKNDTGSILDINFRRETAEGPDNTIFFVSEGGGSETLDIDGMEKALYVNMPTSRYRYALHLLHANANHKEWYDWPMYDNPDPDLCMPIDYETMRTYVYANYSFCSTSLDKNALVEIAQSMR